MWDDIVFILILSVLLLGVFKIENRRYVNTISVETTKCLKGFLCIMLILFHLPSSVKGHFVSLSNETGYLIVACFFLLSGYGLASKYEYGYEANIMGGKKKIRLLIVPWLFASFIYISLDYSRNSI